MLHQGPFQCIIVKTQHLNCNIFFLCGYVYDEETGLYYLQSRYYDPEIGRFINADAFTSTSQGFVGNNMFAYCLNNPANCVDPSGFRPALFDGESYTILEPIDYFTTSNIYGITVGGVSIALAGGAAAISSGIKNAPRPSNIGSGIYAKQCASELQMVSNFDNASSKALNYAAYGVAVIDVGIGIYDNINNGASVKKIALDASIDAIISGGSIWAAGAAGSAIGTAVGTIIPGAGNVVGAGAGFLIGIGLYVVTDMLQFNGKSLRTMAKEGVNSLW